MTAGLLALATTESLGVGLAYLSEREWLKHRPVDTSPVQFAGPSIPCPNRMKPPVCQIKTAPPSVTEIVLRALAPSPSVPLPDSGGSAAEGTP